MTTCTLSEDKNMEHLPYEHAHSLNDAYSELKGLKDDVDEELRVLQAMANPNEGRIKELKLLSDRLNLSLSRIGAVLFHLDPQARMLHPELADRFEKMRTDS